LGIEIDPKANQTAKGEASFHEKGSKVQLWTMPTNEELMVARQSRDLLLAQ
jgi:acetate kinase